MRTVLLVARFALAAALAVALLALALYAAGERVRQLGRDPGDRATRLN